MPFRRRTFRLPRSTRRVTRYRASGSYRAARPRYSRFTRSRRVIRRRPMSRRRLLNVTSTKKSDTMMPVVVDTSGVGTDGPLLVTPEETGGGFNSLFIPSARNFTDYSTPYGRESGTIYARGYKDRIHVTVSGGATWSWRRTAFLMKGPRLRNFFLDNSVGQQYDGLGPSAGETPARTIGPMPDQIATLIRAYIYRGTQGVDWYDPLTASLDKTKITVLSDKVISINPGNESGRSRKYKFWTPINKNIVYGGHESSEIRVGSAYSTEALPGAGDLYIFDQVVRDTPNASGSIAPTLRFSPEGTFYWHER